MKLLNYLKDAIKDINKKEIPNYEEYYPEVAEEMRRVLNKASKAEKFILPVSGKIINDGLKGLPEIIRLPFPVVVLEYYYPEDLVDEVNPGTPSHKRVIVAIENEDLIDVYELSHRSIGERPGWTFVPYKAFITPATVTLKQGESPTLHMRTKCVGSPRMLVENFGLEWKQMSTNDLVTPFFVLLEFIEALSCSNVTYSDKMIPITTPAKQKKDALKYSSYRVLSVTVKDSGTSSSGYVEGEHSPGRSKREHLRRGHIRRYKSGLKVWINNIIVNAGKGGVVSKDYLIKK
jgi:hypothetical protein